MKNGDLEADDGLETATIISLYSDRRVTDTSLLPPNTNSVRGWWGDEFNRFEGDQYGSRLWLLERNKATDSTLVVAEQYILEATNWMRRDGVAESISVLADYDDQRRALAELSIKRPQVKDEDLYSVIWQSQELIRG